MAKNKKEQLPKIVDVTYHNEVKERFNAEVFDYYNRHNKDKGINFEIRLNYTYTQFQYYLHHKLKTELTIELLDKHITLNEIENFYNDKAHKKLVVIKELEAEKTEKQKDYIKDIDFIKGTIEFTNCNNQCIIITKNGESREFTAKYYFDLHLENWCLLIDNESIANNKIAVINNGILSFQKEYLCFDKEPKVQQIITGCIDYLVSIKTHNNFETLNEPKQLNVIEKMPINPFQNYEQFTNDFNLLKKRIETNCKNLINTEAIGYINVSMLGTINSIDIGLNALNEVKALHSTQIYKDKIITDYNSFKIWITEIENKNECIKTTLPLNSTTILEINNKIDAKKKITESELSIFYYAKIVNAFYSFFEPIIELIPMQAETISKNQKATVIESKEPENPHPTIFVNGYAYQMFLEWHNKFENDSSRIKANYSFFISQMIIDKLILDVKKGSYLEFLATFKINIDKIKPIAECTTVNKTTTYNDTKKAIYTRYNVTS